MKNLLIIFLLFNALSAFAQKADSVTAKAAKTRNIDGTIMSSKNSILTNLSASPGFSILTSAIQKASLLLTFNSSDPITVFAPTNKAFEKLPAGQLDTLLLPTHETELTNLLMYHAIAGKLTSKDMEHQIKAGNGQAIFTTMAGGTITARINENRNIVLTDENGGQSIIARLDIDQSNGELFIVDSVLLPKAKQ